MGTGSTQGGKLISAAKPAKLINCMCCHCARRFAGSPQQAQAQAQLDMVSQRLDALTTIKCCYQTVLSDPDLVADCLAFYK
jgi:hypothetical protein